MQELALGPAQHLGKLPSPELQLLSKVSSTAREEKEAHLTIFLLHREEPPCMKPPSWAASPSLCIPAMRRQIHGPDLQYSVTLHHLQASTFPLPTSELSWKKAG